MGILRWLGYVKLADYGLELTPERRIRKADHVVLDDGAGGAIVGWEASDPGIDRLARWDLVRYSRAGIEAERDAVPVEVHDDALVHDAPTVAANPDDGSTVLWRNEAKASEPVGQDTVVTPPPEHVETQRAARGTKPPPNAVSRASLQRQDPWRNERTVLAAAAARSRKSA